MIPTDEVVDLLVALIRNECVNDGSPGSGHEERSAATLAAYLNAAGTMVEPSPGRTSIVYRVPGRVPGAPRLLLIPHLDVVPATSADWRRPPFAGIVDEGFVWGRGAVDMLNMTAAMAAVFRRYLHGELPPLAGDLILAAVADEEAGGALGARYLVENRWDLVACEFALTEVAAPAFPSEGGPIIPVTVAEKGPAWRRLRTSGRPGHGSQPYGAANALLPLAAAVDRLGSASTPIVISEEWRRFVVDLPIADDVRRRLLSPDDIDEAIAEIAITDPTFARWAHACTHMTVSPTSLHAGVKVNVIPDDATAELDVRLLPGQDRGDLDAHLEKAVGPELWGRLIVEPVLDEAATRSDAAGPLWSAIDEAAQSIVGDHRLVPALIPVATDARFLRGRGVTAYGVGIFDDTLSFGDMLAMFHGIDERVSVRSVGLTANFLAETMAAFGRRTG